MTFYLVEGALLLALTGTIAGLLFFRRELRALKAYQANYASSLDETSLALMSVGDAIRDVNVQGMRTLNSLIAEIDRAKGVLEEIEAATSVASAKRSASAR